MRFNINILLSLRNTIILSKTCPQIYNVNNIDISIYNKYIELKETG